MLISQGFCKVKLSLDRELERNSQENNPIPTCKVHCYVAHVSSLDFLVEANLMQYSPLPYIFPVELQCYQPILFEKSQIFLEKITKQNILSSG